MNFFNKSLLLGLIFMGVYFLPAQQLNFAPLAQTGNCLSGDCQTGTGKYQDASGNVYEGGFEEGKFNGKGKLTLASGDICEGWFLNGIENLSGMIRESESGDTIKTVFTNLRIPDGIVSVHQSDGVIYHGSFKADRYTNGSTRSNLITDPIVTIHRQKYLRQSLADYLKKSANIAPVYTK